MDTNKGRGYTEQVMEGKYGRSILVFTYENKALFQTTKAILTIKEDNGKCRNDKI
jgi:hypothetical protein